MPCSGNIQLKIPPLHSPISLSSPDFHVHGKAFFIQKLKRECLYHIYDKLSYICPKDILYDIAVIFSKLSCVWLLSLHCLFIPSFMHPTDTYFILCVIQESDCLKLGTASLPELEHTSPLNSECPSLNKTTVLRVIHLVCSISLYWPESRVTHVWSVIRNIYCLAILCIISYNGSTIHFCISWNRHCCCP